VARAERLVAGPAVQPLVHQHALPQHHRRQRRRDAVAEPALEDGRNRRQRGAGGGTGHPL